MSNEHEVNQKVKTPESVINPDAQAYINASINAAVSEAVKSVFAGLQPHLAAMALSPEKLAIAIREANRPIEDPKKIAAALREERESLKSKEDEAEVRRQTAERQKNCPHSDKSGRDALCLTHNWPDRLPRGICPLCHALIHPREWRIGTALSHPERKDHAYIVDEHPLYHRVRSLESMS